MSKRVKRLTEYEEIEFEFMLDLKKHLLNEDMQEEAFSDYSGFKKIVNNFLNKTKDLKRA